MNTLKRYYIPEIVIFGIVFATLIIDLNPDYTFMNKAADSIGYLYSAKYLYPSYHTSPPLYLLVSHLFLMIPYGTEAWRMGLLSVFATVGACLFIYLIIRRLLPDKRYLALLGVFLYGTSALVISQTVIVQTYPLVCMLAVGAYYFALRKNWKLMGLMIGIGLAVHLLMGFVFIIMLIAYKEYRKNWKALLITLSFGLFYLYIPITNRPPYMWLPNPDEVNSVWAFLSDTFSVILMLIGRLSIWDFPKRIFDTIGIVGVSIGGASIIPIIYYFRKNKIYRNVLFWLIMIPIFIFISQLDMNTYDYTMLSIPFLTIAVCLGFALIKMNWLKYAVVLSVIGFGLFNANYFDIGRTIDRDLSAKQLYYEEFSKIPDDAIFMPNYGWEWEAIFKYNKDFNKNIYPICMDILPSELYRKQLRKDGILLEDSNNENTELKSREIARSIVTLNDNVWTTQSINPETFGSIVISTNHDVSLLYGLDEAKAKEIAEHPTWKYKPYNPYNIITTSIYVTEWRYIILSNYSVIFFVSLASIGFAINWFLFILPAKRRSASEH